MQNMPMSPLRINMGCLERVMRFVQRDMEPDEVMTFVAHVQDCFECRDYVEALVNTLDRRERILERLAQKGG